MKIWALHLLLLAQLIAFGQKNYDASGRYSPQELTEDFDYLVSAYKAAHPGLYWHTDSVSFNAFTALVRNSISTGDSLTETEFLRKAGLINSVVRCAHSNVWLSAEHENWWTENAKLLPLNLFKAGDKYYIWQNYSENPRLNFGTEVLAINEVPVEELIEKIKPYIPGDGLNTTRRNHAIKTGFYSYYSLFINESSADYSLHCTFPGSNDTASISVKGIKYKELNEKRDWMKTYSPPIKLTFIDSLSSAKLTITTFRKDLYEDAGIDFKTTLDSFFTALKNKNTTSLVIDLRDNTGGYSEYGAALLEYLTDKPFDYCRNQWVTSDSLLPFIAYDIPETFKGFPEGIVATDGGYKWLSHSVLKKRIPTKNAFKGRVYFIINGRGTSTTSEVASIARENKAGIFIGEEIGGTYKGNTGGVLGYITLPHTKVTAQIGMVNYELAVTGDNNGQGVTPDYTVERTIDDWLKNRDPEMETAVKLIMNKY